MVEKMKGDIILFLLFILILMVVIAIPTSKLEVFLTALLSSLVFGSISPLIAARRLYFLAVEVSHIALLAVALSIVLANTTPINNEVLWAIALGIIMIYMVGLAIHRGIDPDIITSVITAASVSGSVIAIHLVLTRYRVNYSLWSLILGDPLLVTRRDLYTLIIITAIVVTISVLTYKVVIYVGVDRDSAMLTFRNIGIYEFLFFTSLGLASIALLRIVGYVIEHILILFPALISMNLVEGGRRVMVMSIYVSVISTLLGFILSLKINIAPAGAIGLTALSIYIFSLVVGRLNRYG